jgi:hypothetical protein
MTNINDLIAQLCPDGVEFVPLGTIAEVSAGNSAPQGGSFYKNGIYPFCRTSDVGRVHVSVDFSDIESRLNKEGATGMRLFRKETILFPKSGASTLLNHRVLLSIDSYVSSHLATIYRNSEVVLARFLFYFLCGIDAAQLVPYNTYPSLKTATMKEILVPLPPFPVQEEIVRILDKFSKATTELIAALTKEIELRRKQYEYYRESLLSFKTIDGVERERERERERGEP